MDLNALYFHHQLALNNAATGRALDDREAYFDLARYYARRIHDARKAMGRQFPGWPALPVRPANGDAESDSIPVIEDNA